MTRIGSPRAVVGASIARARLYLSIYGPSKRIVPRLHIFVLFVIFYKRDFFSQEAIACKPSN